MRAHPDVACVGVCFIPTRRVLCIVLCHRYQCRHSSGLTIPVPIFGDWGTFSLTSVSNGDTLHLAWFTSLMRIIILEASLPPSHWPLTLEIWSDLLSKDLWLPPDSSRSIKADIHLNKMSSDTDIASRRRDLVFASRRLYTSMPSSLTNID